MNFFESKKGMIYSDNSNVSCGNRNKNNLIVSRFCDFTSYYLCLYNPSCKLEIIYVWINQPSAELCLY